MRIRSGRPSSPPPLTRVHATAGAVSVHVPKGALSAAEVQTLIGAPGEPEALLSRARRLEVAPSFYACATSFTKFLVGETGIEATVDALPALDSEAHIAAAAGKSMDALRAEWRKEIGAD